ncbi:hypothetical protein TNCV_507451 [Trichonephila clavipes]|nr:hypothetical protein TNCV_507451 [Trichonephila clavipes]
MSGSISILMVHTHQKQTEQVRDLATGPDPAWLLTRLGRSTAIPEWVETTCSNALDSINIQLTTSSVGTEWLDLKKPSPGVG